MLAQIKRNTTPAVVRFARQTAPKALVSVTFFEESVMGAKKMPSDKAMTFPVELESPDPPLIMKMATPAVMMRTGRNCRQGILRVIATVPMKIHRGGRILHANGNGRLVSDKEIITARQSAYIEMKYSGR